MTNSSNTKKSKIETEYLNELTSKTLVKLTFVKNMNILIFFKRILT
jgi:hypothetical protein